MSVTEKNHLGQVIRLLDAGATLGAREIRDHLGCEESTAHRLLRDLANDYHVEEALVPGAAGKRRRRVISAKSVPLRRKAGGRIKRDARAWDASELKELRAAYEAGTSFEEMSRRFARSIDCIRQRGTYLGWRHGSAKKRQRGPKPAIAPAPYVPKFVELKPAAIQPYRRGE